MISGRERRWVAASFGLALCVAACVGSPPLSKDAAGTTAPGGATGAAGGATGAAGATGTAGTTTSTGAAADPGTAGTTGTAATPGGSGAAGDTTGTAGTGAAGDTGTVAAAGGGGGPSVAGSGGGGSGVGGSADPQTCTMDPSTGTGGGTGDACGNSSWTFTPSHVCDPTQNPACNFQASARAPSNAIDGDSFTRYTSGQVQLGDESFVLSFAAPVSIRGLTLDSSGSPLDATTSYLAEYSLDGTTFFGWCPALAGPGGPVLDIVLPARMTVKALRITQTGQAVDGHSWWSINELTLDGCLAP